MLQFHDTIVVVKKVCKTCGTEVNYTNDRHNSFVGVSMNETSRLEIRLGYIKAACSSCGSEDATYIHVQVRPRTDADVSSPHRSMR